MLTRAARRSCHRSVFVLFDSCLPVESLRSPPQTIGFVHEVRRAPKEEDKLPPRHRASSASRMVREPLRSALNHRYQNGKVQHFQSFQPWRLVKKQLSTLASLAARSFDE